MNKYKFFVFCPEDGFEVFETLDDALDDTNEKIKGYLVDGWSEDVTGVCAGKITHRAKMCDQVFRDGEIDEDGIDDAGDYWDPDFGYKCNYKMMPVEPAHDVSVLVEALEEIIHPVRFMQERLEEGEHLNGMVAVQLAKDPEYLRDIAIAALAAYREK